MTQNSDPQNDDRLSAYLDDELPDNERAEFESMLESRADYRETLEQFKRQRDELGALPQHQAPSHAHQRILDRIDQLEIARPTTETIPGNTQKGWRLSRPLAVLSAIGALAACLALTTTLTNKHGSVETASAPSESVSRDIESRSNEAELGAVLDELKDRDEMDVPAGDFRTRSREAIGADSPATPSVSAERMRTEEADRSDSIDTESLRTPATREVLSGDDDGPYDGEGIAASEDREPDAASQSTMPVLPPMTTAEPSTAARESGLMRDDANAELLGEVPEIVIEVRSEDVYDQLLTVMSEARLSAETPEDAMRQQGYYDVQEQLASRRQVGGRQAEPMMTQVIEVTSTADDIVELIDVARGQGAEVTNSAVAVDQIAQARRKSQTLKKELAQFSGAINNWQQVDVALENESSSAGQAQFGLRGALGKAANQAEDQTRWRITIQPVTTAPNAESE